MRQWGIWHNQPGHYVGWSSLTVEGKRTTMLFDEEEARRFAARSEYCEARICPDNEREGPWNEDVWAASK